MIVKRVRSGSAAELPLVLIFLCMLCSCVETSASDPRQELIDSLEGANVEGYLFAMSEDDSHTAASLTNKAANDLTTLGKEDTNLVLRYTTITDKKTKTATTYKAEVVRKDDSLALAVTDLTTDRVVDTQTFPTSGPACQPPGPFASVNACLQDFDCTRRGPLLCEANRTCKPQLAAVTCCLTDGTVVSVHLIVKPTKIRCLLQDLTADLEGLVLSRD